MVMHGLGGLGSSTSAVLLGTCCYSLEAVGCLLFGESVQVMVSPYGGVQLSAMRRGGKGPECWFGLVWQADQCQ